jgi:hypothetical protein
LDTVAICVLLEIHEAVRPVRTLLLASRVTAVPCVVSPTRNVLAASVTLTVATPGGVTVIVCDPDLPPMVAVIAVEPGATPVTRPAALTVAIVGVALSHVTGRPVRALPFTSIAVAVSCSVPPIATVVADAETLTIATAAGPEESPPHARADASVQSQTSARRGCFSILESRRRGIEHVSPHRAATGRT